MALDVDTVVLATGGGLVIIGTITRKLAPIAVGTSFLLARAYVNWRKGQVGAEKPTIKGAPQDADSPYKAGGVLNERLTAAQDAWYQLHPDGPPFVNDDGSYNLPPGYTL